MMKKFFVTALTALTTLAVNAQLPEAVLELPLNTGDFSAIKDESGKCKVKVEGTAQLSWTEGPEGKALQFNGVKTAPRGAVTVTMPKDFKMSSGFSLRMIFKTADDHQRKMRYQLFQYGSGADKVTGISGFLYWNSLQCRFGNASKTTLVTPANVVIKPATWYDCVITFDGKNLMSYLNGKAMTKPTPAVIPEARRNNICIGSTSSAGTGYPFKGAISSVTIYPRALTAEEISNL
jgi:hypothetical protein